MDLASLVTYLFPKLILKTSSQFNRDIRIIEEAGRLKLLVNGSRQSGPYIENLWRYALDRFGINESLITKRILVLGVGGGTVVKLISKLFPQAQITGVDIDPTIIRLGKKYFNIGDILHFTIRITDARQFVADAVARKDKYDLVIVDLFTGRHIPPFITSNSFLKALRAIMRTRGVLLINYLRELEYQRKSEDLYNKLLAFYFWVKDLSIARNRFFLAFR